MFKKVFSKQIDSHEKGEMLIKKDRFSRKMMGFHEKG